MPLKTNLNICTGDIYKVFEEKRTLFHELILELKIRKKSYKHSMKCFVLESCPVETFSHVCFPKVKIMQYEISWNTNYETKLVAPYIVYQIDQMYTKKKGRKAVSLVVVKEIT